MAKANTRVTRHRGGEDHGKQKFRQSGESGQKLCKVHKIYGTRAYGCLDTDTCHVGPDSRGWETSRPDTGGGHLCPRPS